MTVKNIELNATSIIQFGEANKNLKVIKEKNNLDSLSDLIDFKSWSNAKGVVTVAIDSNARQPSSISLRTPRLILRINRNYDK